MKALVTGGTGFLGRRLAIRLRDAGWEVTAMARRGDARQALHARGIRFLQADLRNKEAVLEACAGQDAVFHCGALSSSWGAYQKFYDTNVTGTAHVIEGCIRHGAARMIHVSTPSVCFGSGHRMNVRETDPLPARPASSYAATKQLAEDAVNRAVAAGLPAIIIRPRAVIGPGDTSILPRLIAANAQRRLPMIDQGRALIDLTYVDNVVDAMVLCQKAPADRIGRTYHISNGEPLPFAEAAQRLFRKLGQPLHAKRLSFAAAYTAASLMELTAALLPGSREPMLTRAVAGMIGRSQTLDIGAARSELGYTPHISIDEGLDAFAAWWRECSHDA
ncbi:2-alkyl-3-oxoalkanoate reductase [Paenibacillus solanacearum]|uniref:2-alkyl-3-oxoalkanoate reductase n=1 Tax=Paenibacillus solanacearum TaxID=2048548 RepID=A0A916K418_9BACL|nr:NAD-dependent epimerase/dehydratase family protein [Paenibacillus solanacearum]CAG7642011.1 2-alkyl-3-oxoalkanoate reductase [Paenibacillus solanacearum]